MSTEQGIGWRNANRYRSYPLRDDVSMLLSDGSTLSNNVLLDASAVVYGSSDQTFQLTQLRRATDVLYVQFLVGTTSVELSVVLNADLTLPVVVYSAAYRLSVVFGEDLFTLFSANGALTCTIPLQPALLTVQDRVRVDTVSGQTGPQLVGRIQAQEGYNCRLTLTNDNGPALLISAIYGAGAGVYCDPLVGVRRCDDTILRINGLAGSTSGDFVIAGLAGVTVRSDPATNTITVTGTRTYDKVGCQNVTA